MKKFTSKGAGRGFFGPASRVARLKKQRKAGVCARGGGRDPAPPRRAARLPIPRGVIRKARMYFRSLALLVALLLTAGRGLAELKWDRPVQSFQRTPEDGEIEVRFAFRNAGAGPVTIKTLRPSCGCTTAYLEKKTFAPGEAGEVVAHFVFGDRRGPHRKTIEVRTDDAAAESVVLDLRVNIHDPLTIAPALVFWKRGEPGEAKTVQLTADTGQPVRIKSVVSSNPRVAAKLETIKAGQQYVVSVTPADTAQKESAEISLLTDFPADAPRTYVIHARVK